MKTIMNNAGTYDLPPEKIKQKKLHSIFESNRNNLQNTWDGIKIEISLQSFASNFPQILSYDDTTIISPTETENEFNNYFSTVVEESKSPLRLFKENQ